MTEAEIIFAANDSGITYYGMGKDRAKFLHHLQAFAELVAAQEREECAKLADIAEPYRTADLIRARGQA